MEQFDFIINTISKVTVQAQNKDEAHKLLESQLPSNANINNYIDADMSTIRYLALDELNSLKGE